MPYQSNYIKCFLVAVCFSSLSIQAQDHAEQKIPTRADSLRGSINEERSWWDVTHYTINVEPDFNTKTIQGKVDIQFKVLDAGKTMQIDLQEPLVLISATLKNKSLSFTREGNVYHITIPNQLTLGSSEDIVLTYGGKVVEAVNPPWDGGWIFKKDKLGRDWMSVACQGLGASVWYPCKDHQSDEPNLGATISITIPDTLVAVGNGRLIEKKVVKPNTMTFVWNVKSPINNYNIVPYIGKYVEFHEIFPGENGPLDCSYWVLDYNLEKAKAQFKQVPLMLKAFEYAFGPYPFYEDSYKLVESPHLGMEHQSAVAYGNAFKNGYLGNDLSQSGWGLKWDYIIIHESGHEWFANNITTKDIADMWIHEGFTDYSETVYTTYYYGKEAGDEYTQGLRKRIGNDKPLIGPYGVNKGGSGDMYNKGNNIIHYIKQMFKNDDAFYACLRAMNKEYYHQTVTSADIENFISKKSGINLSKFFDQYLRTKDIPVLLVKKSKKGFRYKWTECIENYEAPLKMLVNNHAVWISPTTSWKSLHQKEKIADLSMDKNCYAEIKIIE